MSRRKSERDRQEQMEHLVVDLERAWLEDADADVSNLIDEGLRDPKRFAWELTRRAGDERVLLLLSVQRALVGAVSPSLLGACVTLRGRTIVLTFYVSSDAKDDEREDLRAVGAEVVGDFTGNFLLEEVFHDISDRAEPLPTVGEWVHLQRGLRSR